MRLRRLLSSTARRSMEDVLEVYQQCKTGVAQALDDAVRSEDIRRANAITREASRACVPVPFRAMTLAEAHLPPQVTRNLVARDMKDYPWKKYPAPLVPMVMRTLRHDTDACMAEFRRVPVNLRKAGHWGEAAMALFVAGDVDGALKLYHELHELQEMGGVGRWRVPIRLFQTFVTELASRGRLDDAVEVSQDMMEAGYEPTGRVMLALMNAHADRHDLDSAKRIVGEMREANLARGPRFHRDVVGMLCRNWALTDAIDAYVARFADPEQLGHDAESLNMLRRAFTTRANIEDRLRLEEEVRELRLIDDVTNADPRPVLRQAIKSNAVLRDYTTVWEALNARNVPALTPETIVTDIVARLERSVHMQQTWELIQGLVADKQTDVLSPEVLEQVAVKACECGMYGRASGAFLIMKSLRHRPPATSAVRAVVSALEERRRGRQIQEVEQIIADMHTRRP